MIRMFRPGASARGGTFGQQLQLVARHLDASQLLQRGKRGRQLAQLVLTGVQEGQRREAHYFVRQATDVVPA